MRDDPAVLGFRDVAIRCGLAAVVTVGLAGCGEQARDAPARTTSRTAMPPGDERAAARLRPVPAGRGPAFRLPARGARAQRGLPIGSARCLPHPGRRVEAHLELFARGLVVPIPPGIGIAPPLRRRGAYVLGGRCSYPVRTTEPTGLLELRARATLTLGDVFEIWGQPLSRVRLARFRGPVRAYVGGVRWRGDPRAIPVRRHAVIVLQLGPQIPPHARYHFPHGD